MSDGYGDPQKGKKMQVKRPKTLDAKIPVQSHTLKICMDEYAAITAPFFAISPILRKRDSGLNFALAWHTDLCFFGYAESNPFSRRRATQEIENSGHLVEVTRFISGTERGTSGENVISRVPGPIYILDQEQPVHALTSKFKVQQVYVPKANLGLRPDQLLNERCIESSDPMGDLLHTCMTELYETLGKNSAAIQSNLVHRFFALLKVSLGVHPRRGDVRTHVRDALFQKICRHIEQNLGDPDFSTNSLLRSFGVSRASLYRMFEDHGGVRSYITERRVVRAVLDISTKAYARGQMRRASERWGFSTQPIFNRTIKREFGTTPGELFDQQPSQTQTPEIKDQFMERFAAQTALAA